MGQSDPSGEHQAAMMPPPDLQCETGLIKPLSHRREAEVAC
jgi:hypothetical protein